MMSQYLITVFFAFTALISIPRTTPQFRAFLIASASAALVAGIAFDWI